MDFRAALVNNINPNTSYMNPEFQPTQMNDQVRNISPIGNRKAPGETPTRRRRRRRNHGSKTAGETLVEYDERTLQERECVLQEHTPPYTPLRGDFGDVPALQVLEASPVAFSWPPYEAPERFPVEILNAIAERARERLSIRIQAYWDEKQKVVEAAARIQEAYASHMESQLGMIVTAMQGRLSAAIDTKLDSFKHTWQEEISGTLGDLEINITSRDPHSVDPKLVKAARISALEGETQRLMDITSNEKIDRLAAKGARHGDMLAILKQLQAQGERTDRSLKELFGISKQHSVETKELRDAMNTAGLLPQVAIAATPQKAKTCVDNARVKGSAKGKHPLILSEGKENPNSSVFGLSSSPMKSNQNTGSMVQSSLQI